MLRAPVPPPSLGPLARLMSEKQWGLQATHQGTVPTSLGPWIITWGGELDWKRQDHCPCGGMLTKAG